MGRQLGNQPLVPAQKIKLQTAQKFNLGGPHGPPARTSTFGPRLENQLANRPEIQAGWPPMGRQLVLQPLVPA